MKLRRVICLVLSLAAVASLFLVSDSVAWFDTQTGTALGQEIDVDRMYFVFHGTIGSYYQYEATSAGGTHEEFILPGQNLIIDNGGAITGRNFSTIDTEVRFLITYDTNSTQNVQFKNDGTDAISVDLAAGWTKGDTDNYFYNRFIGSDETQDITLLTSLSYSEGLSQDDYSNVSGSISIEIQAKQEDYLEWATVATL